MDYNFDFYEFIDYVNEEDVYLYIPKRYIRDQNNPLEIYSNTELKERFRFSGETIQNILLPLVYGNRENPNHRGLPIPPILKLCTALRFYATGSYQRVSGDLISISQSSTCRIIKEVSKILSTKFRQFIKFPSNDAIRRNRQKFYEQAGFPGVTGCIDCTHIPIINPGGDNAEVYRNRKGWMSINVQAIVGPRGEIFDLVTRWPGSAHDSRIFHNSFVKFRFENNLLPELLLGDSGYSQLPFLFTPLQNPQTRSERRYNLSHCSTRNVVERCFGMWKQRFRCISKKLLYKLNHSIKIVAATAVLHNIALESNENFILETNFPNDNHEENENAEERLEDVRGNIARAAFIERHFQ